MSVAFAPTPKDRRHLSTDRECISAEDSFKRYQEREGVSPAATWPIKVGTALDAHKCLPQPPSSSAELHVLDDGGTENLPDGHASVVYAEAYEGVTSKNGSRKIDERLATEIKKAAIATGPLYSAPPLDDLDAPDDAS